MKFNTRKAVIAMFSISVLVILVLNFGISDNQELIMETQYLIDTVEIITPDIRYEEQQKQQKQYEKLSAEKLLELERKSVIRDTFSISEPQELLEPESLEEPEIMMSETLEPPVEPMLSESQQVIIVQMPQQQLDWKSLISWAIAALNGVVLLLMNIKNLKKK